jgi:hypothetical protein
MIEYDFKEEGQIDATITVFLKNSNYLDMFRAIILPIVRSIRLYNAACGMRHPMSWRAVVLSSSRTTRPAANSLGASYYKLHYTV